MLNYSTLWNSSEKLRNFWKKSEIYEKIEVTFSECTFSSQNCIKIEVFDFSFLKIEVFRGTPRTPTNDGPE